MSDDDEALDEELPFAPRGPGNNWLPCFICGARETPSKLRTDMASHVGSKENGEKVVALFESLGLTAKLDYREHEPNWVQVKIGACPGHVPNLVMLMHVTENVQQVHLAPVEEFDVHKRPMDQYGEKLAHEWLWRRRPSTISRARLQQVIPGPIDPGYPACPANE